MASCYNMLLVYTNMLKNKRMFRVSNLSGLYYKVNAKVRDNCSQGPTIVAYAYKGRRRCSETSWVYRTLRLCSLCFWSLYFRVELVSFETHRVWKMIFLGDCSNGDMATSALVETPSWHSRGEIEEKYGKPKSGWSTVGFKLYPSPQCYQLDHELRMLDL